MEDAMIIQKMKELADLIGYKFNNITFIKEAMHCQIVHKVGDGENRKNYTNDSLATLGDSILKFILTEHLFDKGYDKKDITEIKKH